MDEIRRKCFKCGCSPAKHNVKLFRFPKPGVRNLIRCLLWAKFILPEGHYNSLEYQKKLYSDHRMLCEKHFKDADFKDVTKARLLQTAVPCNTEHVLIMAEPQATKQKVKLTIQVGPGQAGESHAESLVSPHHILGGGEKWQDVETRDRGQVREGETQREKSPESSESTGAEGIDLDRQRHDTERSPPRRARGKRLRPPHRGNLAASTLPGASEPQPGPSGSGAAKRERPDDTASLRAQAAQEEQRTFARAAKDIPARLCVAICFPTPSRDLTNTEATYIRTELERLVMETDSTEPLPAFRGYPRVADGTVQMWCEDDNTLTWLKLNVPKIRLPDTDLTLTVMRQTDIRTLVRAELFVPGFNGDIAQLLSVLIRQNTWYDIGRWSLYRATSVGGDNYGTYLTLGIPTDEAEKVLGRERRISYLLGSIYVRFYPKTEPSHDRIDTETETTEPTLTDVT